jgi:hypothetical protein
MFNESGVHCGVNAVSCDVDDGQGSASACVVKDVDKIAAINKVARRPEIRSTDIEARQLRCTSPVNVPHDIAQPNLNICLDRLGRYSASNERLFHGF